MKENEHVEITLTMLVAHLMFILSEVVSNHLVVFDQRIRLSSIIATVMASMVIGNYGRFKISPGVEEYMEKFWSYFAFIANSLVFILMGLLFADLPIHFSQFVVPTFVTVVVVIIGRALSIYPVAWLANRTKSEEPIPRSWQHLLAWGSQRGALAMTMVLLIPDDLRIPGWEQDFTVKEFVAALTIGCIYFTLIVKATTIGTMIKRMRLAELSPLESITYHESRALIYARALELLETFRRQGSVTEAVCQRLMVEYADRYQRSCAACQSCFTAAPGDMGRALQAYALGMERSFLRELFVYHEIDEAGYKEILKQGLVRAGGGLAARAVPAPVAGGFAPEELPLLPCPADHLAQSHHPAVVAGRAFPRPVRRPGGLRSCDRLVRGVARRCSREARRGGRPPRGATRRPRRGLRQDGAAQGGGAGPR